MRCVGGNGSVSLGGEPFGAGDGVLDVALFVAVDADRPIGDEFAHQSHARLLHHATRPDIDRHCLCVHALNAQFAKATVDQRERALGAEAFAPSVATQPVAKLRLKRSGTIARSEVKPTKEGAGCFFVRCPKPVARFTRVMSEPPIEVLDALVAIDRRAVVDVALHSRVAIKLNDKLKIIGGEPTKDQPFGVQINVHIAHGTEAACIDHLNCLPLNVVPPNVHFVKDGTADGAIPDEVRPRLVAMATLRRWRGRIGPWGLAAGVLAVVPIVLGYLHRTHINEDSYITFAYSRSLAAGNGFRVNGGAEVLGTTSPLWAILVASASVVVPFLSIPTLAALLSGLAWSGVVVLMYCSRRSWGLTAPMALLYCTVLVSGIWVLHFGMEVMGFAFLLTAAACAFLSDRLVLAGVCAGLLPIMRGEGIIVCGLLILWQLWRVRDERFVRRSTPLLVAIALPIVVWTAYALVVFGSPIPTTLAAKQNQLQSSLFASFPHRLWHEWLPQWPDYTRVHGISPWWLLIAVGLIDVAVRHRVRVVWLVWGLAYAVAYTAIGTAGYWWYQLPLLFVAYHMLASGAVAVIEIVQHAARRIARSRSMHARRAAPVVAALGAVCLVLLFVLIPAARRSDGAPADPRHQPYKVAAEWLRDATPADSTVAVIEVGFISYYSERPIVDLAGLLTPDIAPHLKLGDFAWGFWQHMPDYYVRMDRFDHWFVRLHDDPCFQESYAVVQEFPGVATDNILIYQRLDGTPACEPSG